MFLRETERKTMRERDGQTERGGGGEEERESERERGREGGREGEREREGGGDRQNVNRDRQKETTRHRETGTATDGAGRRSSRRKSSNAMQQHMLTFDHDHVDIDGADWRLRESLPFLQQARHLPGPDVVVGLLAVGEQLPGRHTCTNNNRHLVVFYSYLWVHLHL